MSIRFFCLHCGKQLTVADALAGKRGKCPACGQAVEVPKTSSPHATPSETTPSHSAPPSVVASAPTLAPASPQRARAIPKLVRAAAGGLAVLAILGVGYFVYRLVPRDVHVAAVPLASNGNGVSADRDGSSDPGQEQAEREPARNSPTPAAAPSANAPQEPPHVEAPQPARQDAAPQQPAPEQRASPALEAAAPPPTLAELVERVKPSVVKIQIEDGPRTSLGSGFVVREGGMIATNLHVVAGAKKGRVTFHDGKEVPLDGFYKIDEVRDLALVHVDPAQVKLQALPLCSPHPKQGEEIFVLGNPLGLSFRVTKGVISGVTTTKEIEQDVGEKLGRYFDNMVWLQGDAALSPGNSGGPWFNMRGQVIGVATWMIRGESGLYFASAARELQELLNYVDSIQTEGKVSPLRELPEPSPESIAGRSIEEGEVAGLGTIEVPWGGVMDLDGMFSTELLQLAIRRRLDRSRDDQLELGYPSGRLYALLGRRNGELEGNTLTYYESGAPMTFARYRENMRHGNLIILADSGKLLVLAQYLRGKEHGLVCLYRNDELALASRFGGGKPEQVCLVSGGKAREHHSFENNTASPDEAVTKALDELQGILANARHNEIALKKWLREHFEDERRDKATARNVQSRQRIQDRVNQRAAAQSDLIRPFRPTLPP